MRKLNSKLLVSTTGLMAPEAYRVEAAIVAFAEGRSEKKMRIAAAQHYAQYQQCSLRAARSLFGVPIQP